MTFEQVVLLLTLLGGAIYITFEISWTILTTKRNDRLCLRKQAVILFDLTPEER